MTDAEHLRAELETLNAKTEEIVTTLRRQKALLEEVSLSYGNLSGQTMQLVEGLLEVAERKLDEPISNILIALRHARNWVPYL